MSKQTFIVSMEAEAARRMRRFLSVGEHGYATISEFVEVAVLNQLSMEAARAGHKTTRDRAVALPSPHVDNGGLPTESEPALEAARGALASDALLARPAAAPPSELLESSALSDEMLSSFTNRVSPMKIAVRVAANLAALQGWPTVEEFHRESSATARQLGMLLRVRDGRDGRRSVGYPIGEDADKSISRYITSFTLVERDGRVSGPLIALGLAGIVDGRVRLTRDGWRLAAAPSPLVDGAAGSTLSPAEAKILRDVIRRSRAEHESVREFLRIVRECNGSQAGIDRLLQERKKGWSRDMVVAHRAALVGRLAELEVVEAIGRGAGAIIRLLPGADDLLTTSPASSLPLHLARESLEEK